MKLCFLSRTMEILDDDDDEDDDDIQHHRHPFDDSSSHQWHPYSPELMWRKAMDSAALGLPSWIPSFESKYNRFV